jgi:hypothetical protein
MAVTRHRKSPGVNAGTPAASLPLLLLLALLLPLLLAALLLLLLLLLLLALLLLLKMGRGTTRTPRRTSCSLKGSAATRASTTCSAPAKHKQVCSLQ